MQGPLQRILAGLFEEGGLLSNEKARKAVLVVGLVLIALLLISTFSDGDSADEPVETVDISQQEEHLEQRLCRIVGEIDGVSDPVVMLTLDSSEQHVYAGDEVSSTSSDSGGSTTRSEYSVVLGGSSRQPLETSVILPRVRGVAVICGGAQDPQVRERVVNAVAGVLDISTSRIYVTY